MFVIDPDIVTQNPYVVYSLHDTSGQLQYIGYCKFDQFQMTPDARKNVLFDMVFPGGRNMGINLIETYVKKVDAANHVYRWMQKQEVRPFMMKYGSMGMRNKFVTCKETGDVFNSVEDAAFHAGVSISYMSHHLARRPTHRTVKGKTYGWYRPSTLEKIARTHLENQKRGETTSQTNGS